MARETPNRPTRRASRPSAKHGGRSASTLLLGILVGLAAAFGALWIYRRLHLPVKSPVALSGQPLSPAPAHTPVAAPHPALQAPGPEAAAPPFGISEDVFEAGARIYGSRCASCHGTPRQVAATHSAVLQLWRPNRAGGGTGVSHQRPAQIYRSIAEGAPATGMPAYRGVLTSTQIWQLSLLLGNAGGELPDPVLHLLDARKP